MIQIAVVIDAADSYIRASLGVELTYDLLGRLISAKQQGFAPQPSLAAEIPGENGDERTENYKNGKSDNKTKPQGGGRRSGFNYDPVKKCLVTTKDQDPADTQRKHALTQRCERAKSV